MRNKKYFLNRSIAMALIVLCCTEETAAQYDIYIFDIKKQTTRQVTNSGGSEFNVSFSNNGKKMVHDVIGIGAEPFDQTIYITDVETGVSTRLSGAEGGNDPVWSPNGEKIAFDDYHIYPYSIYSVPAAGGSRSLLRYNAHHASWDPKGNKIVFDDNYGYIGTKDINTGAETFVTYFGDHPAWSPNGQYIAFDGAWWTGGGVWIVKVDTAGYAQGWPAQLTTSGYGPTWKNNSQELVFVDWPNGDPDLYTIPVTGGPARRLCGGVGGFDKGDYDAAYSNDGQFVAWSGFTAENAISSNQRVAKNSTVSNISKSFELEQIYPNPFPINTKINVRITKTIHLTATVFNSLGQKIKTITNADYVAGYYILEWNGQDDNNKTVPNGLYLCELRSENEVQVKKLSVLR